MSRTMRIPKAITLQGTLDIFERVLMVLLFTNMIHRFLPHYERYGNIMDICALLSEGASTFFVLTHRRTSTVSLSASDWGLTIIATVLPTLVSPVSFAPLVPLPICGMLLAEGFILQIWAKLTLRRSFGLAPANRGVKIGGPYRLLRHPMYAGYVMTHLAFLGAYPSFWNFAIYAAAFLAQCARLMAEERILRRDPAYQVFMRATCYRLIPFVF
ncbi:MAG: methyltransferase family protein [Hyphomicrobiales bacterium]